MKLIIKNNMYAIIAFLVLMTFTIAGIVYYLDSPPEYYKSFEVCENLENEPEVIQDINKELCALDYKNHDLTMDRYTMFLFFIKGEYLDLLPIFYFLIIGFCATKKIHDKLRSKYLAYYLTRKSYRSFIVKTLLSAYKTIWIFVAFVILTYIATGFFTDNYDTFVGDNIYFNFADSGKSYFLLTYTSSVALTGLIYINYSLMFLKKNKIYIIALIESYLAYCITNIVLEFLPVKHISNNTLAFTDGIGFFEEPGGLKVLILFITFCITTGIVLLIYRSKEKTVLDIERY